MKAEDFEKEFPREKLREIYKYENGAAFDKFYSGVVKIHCNDALNGIADLKESLTITESPFPYHFMYMASLADGAVTDDEILNMATEWVKVADKSGIPRQVAFSRAALAHETHRRMKEFSMVA